VTKESDIFNACNPVVGIHVYSGGVLRVKRESKIQAKFQYEVGRKDRPIMKFTAKSMARLVATVNASNVKFGSMITLTYPVIFPRDGKTIKAAMNNFTQMMRDQNYGPYLWFLEFQVRGAPHFHILSTQDAISPNMRVRATETWVSRMSKEGWFLAEVIKLAVKRDVCEWTLMSNIIAKSYWFTLREKTWELIRKQDGAKGYATKYATKEYQKVPPKGFQGVGRFWGCSKEVRLGKGLYREMSEDRLRAYLKNTDHATQDWEILPKYLFGVNQGGNAHSNEDVPI